MSNVNLEIKRKVVIASVVAITLMLVALFATLAYLNCFTTTLDNTMTPTALTATIDEAIVNEDGVPVGGRTESAQTYKMVPGRISTKDPKITIASGSEPAYVYMVIDNGLADIEAQTETGTGAYKTIHDQMLDEGWIALKDVTVPEGFSQLYSTVYFWTNGQRPTYNAIVDARSGAVELQGFEKFKVKEGLDQTGLSQVNIRVKGYAIQAEGINTPADGWNILFPSA